MTENHTNQQKIQNNQNNDLNDDLASNLTSIPGVEEVNEADLEGVDGGVLKWCTQTKRWIDVGDYHLIRTPSMPPR